MTLENKLLARIERVRTIKKLLSGAHEMTHRTIAKIVGVSRGQVKGVAAEMGLRRKRGRKPRKDVHNGK
jgi:hypothetical protein